MADSKKIGDAALARKVTAAYAEDIEGFTHEECAKLGIDKEPCEKLEWVLSPFPRNHGMNHTDFIKWALKDSNFSDEFKSELLGADGLKAFRARVKWLGDRAVKRWYRSNASDEEREKAIKYLAPFFGHADESFRDLEPDVKATLPALLETIDDKNTNIRARSAEALGVAIMISPEAVGPVVKALKDPHVYVRMMAAEHLQYCASIESKAEKNAALARALPALYEALGDSDEYVRFKAAETTSLFRHKAAILSKLVDTLINSKYAADVTLLRLGPKVIPLLVDALQAKSVSDSAKQQAMLGLARFGNDAKEAIAPLVELAGDPSFYYRFCVFKAMYDIGPDASAVPVLAAALADDDAETRKIAALALGKVGKPAHHALPFLDDMSVLDPDPSCRKAAGEAVEKILKEVR